MMGTDDQKLEIVVPKSLGNERLDMVLEALVEGVSKARLQKIVRRGGVSVGGRRVTRSNVKVRGGDRLHVDLRDAERHADAGPLIPILHADEHIVVVDKPAGLLTHPADRQGSTSVALTIARSHGPLPINTGPERPGIVHRLDRDTTGVLVLARTEAAMAGLREQFRARTVQKEYTALVRGVPLDDAGEINLALEPEPGELDRQRVARSGGKEALTRWRASERFAGATLLACHPSTGRRHQIRVHLRAVGLPIAGDPLYGRPPRDVEVAMWPAGVALPSRLALHAARLTFEHPGTGERVTFEAPLPPDFESWLAALRA